MGQVPLDRLEAYNKELGFIIAALSNSSCQIDSNLDWIKIETLANEEGVTGILYKNLKEAGIPRSALASFKDYYLSAAAQNLINTNALERLENALESVQIGGMGF